MSRTLTRIAAFSRCRAMRGLHRECVRERATRKKGGRMEEAKRKRGRKMKKEGRERREKRTRMCCGAESCEVRAHLDLLLHRRTRALTAFHSTIQPPNGLPPVTCTKVSSFSVSDLFFFSLVRPSLSLSLHFLFFYFFNRVDRTSGCVPLESAPADTNAFYIGFA